MWNVLHRSAYIKCTCGTLERYKFHSSDSMSVLILKSGSRVPSTRYKQVFSLNPAQPIASNRCCQSAFYVNSRLLSKYDTWNWIEAVTRNWFIYKFDGIWMDLLWVWHLSWIAKFALLIELIFDQFGTYFSLYGSYKMYITLPCDALCIETIISFLA